MFRIRGVTLRRGSRLPVPTQLQGTNKMVSNCQLRRLGARGGAGKPTLLSLKN
jgi:hypothetical protein